MIIKNCLKRTKSSKRPPLLHCLIVTSEAIDFIKEIKNVGDNVDYEKLSFSGGDKNDTRKVN